MIALAIMLAITAKTGDPAHWRTSPQTRSITAYCHAPPRWLVVAGDGSIHFRPPQSAPYAKVMCVAKEMKDRHVGPIGHIGGISS